MKRTLCLFLALILAVGICFSAPVTITASAAFTLESGTEHTVGAVYIDSTTGVKFKITDIETKQVEVCGYDSSPTNLEIPATVTINENEYSVTTIGDSAFDSCESLTSVTIPDSVTTIGRYAFANCTSLTSVTIPDSVKEIHAYAFENCTELTSVTIGKGVTEIDDYAFEGCDDLTTVNVPCSWDGETAGGKTVTKYHTGTLGTPEPTEDGKQHVATYDCCGTDVIENHDYNNENICTKCGNLVAWFTGTKVNDDFSVTFFVECDDNYLPPWDALQLLVYNGDQEVGLNIDYDGQQGYYATMTELNPDCKGITLTAELIIHNYYTEHEKTRTTVEVKNPNNHSGVLGDPVLTEDGEQHVKKWSCCDAEVTEAHTPDANAYTVATDGTHSFKCSGCGTVVTKPHNFENAAHQCACGERETYSITCTETGSKGGAVRLENTEPAIHGQTYTTRLLMPEGLQGWYTDVIKVSVNGEELVKGTDYTYDLQTVTLTVDGEKVTGNIEITYQINAKVTFVLNGGDLESSLKAQLTDGGLNIIDDKITMPLAYGVPSSFDDLNNIFIREGYICTGLKNGEQDADMNAPVVNCTLSVQWQCTHNTIDENDVCTTCGGNYCGADTTKDKVVWFFDGNTLTITGSGAMATYSPESPAPWSTKKTSIENIVIEKGVTNISPYAFGEYSKLKSITIPETVTTIGQYAFYGCTSLETITIPDNVTTISANAFNGCSGLESVTIGNKVASIGERAFYDCSSLTSVTFGENVTSLGNFAFAKCTSLTSIVIPDSVTSIGDSAFKNCASLTTIKLPKEIASISQECFYGCSILKSITIPDSVKTIGANAFYECTSFETITIPKSVEAIGNNAFYNCTNILLFVDKDNINVQKYATDNNINYVVDGSGELEKLTFTINEDGESYSVTAREKTISGALTIPSKFNGKSVTKIGNGAFSNCKSLTSVVIPDSVVSLGEKAFYVCGGLETVTLSSNITVIPNDAFAYCESLKTLPITEKITSIGERAFYASGNLVSVSLSNVTIGSRAFLQCGITELTLENCKLNDASVFINNDIEKLTLSETDIPDEMFDGDPYIKTLVAEDSVLGSRSFKGCQSLKSVTVFGGEIKSDAFLACPSLETVTIDNIGSVGGYAFNNCQALKTVEVNATEISEYAFSMCTSLENVKLSDGVEVIGDAVFEGCDSLAELELPETVTEIGKWVFNDCNLLTELVIPESVTDVSANAFVGCYNLKYIFFVGDEEDIGNEYISSAKIHYGSSTHTFEENYTVDVEPTCTEKGSESQHCKYCDLTQNERPVKELGHTPVNGGTQGAHTKCGVCGEPLSTTHNVTSKVTTAPTCTKDGVETFTCECGYTYTVVVPATGHKEVTVTGKAATCTATGLTDGKKCSVCGTVTVAQQTIAKKGHTEVIIPKVAPTLTSTGLTEGKKCSVCGTVTVSQQVIAKLVLVAPVITSITSTTGGVKFTWGAVPYAAKYKIYRKTYHPSTGKWDAKWKKINKVEVKGTEYVDSTAKLGTQYMYLVKAVNGKVTKNSAASSIVTFKISPTPTIHLKSNGIKIKWAETVVSAENYRIYRAEYNESTKKYNSYKKVKTVKGTTKSWTDTSVKSGKKYKYCVKAVRGSVVCDKVQTKSMYFLTKPKVTVATATNGIVVNWSAKGASKYRVYRSELQNGVWSGYKEIATPNGKTKTYTDTTAVAGVQYKYKIKAVKSKTGIVSSATKAVTR